MLLPACTQVKTKNEAIMSHAIYITKQRTLDNTILSRVDNKCFQLKMEFIRYYFKKWQLVLPKWNVFNWNQGIVNSSSIYQIQDILKITETNITFLLFSNLTCDDSVRGWPVTVFCEVKEGTIKMFKKTCSAEHFRQ